MFLGQVIKTLLTTRTLPLISLYLMVKGLFPNGPNLKIPTKSHFNPGVSGYVIGKRPCSYPVISCSFFAIIL